MAAKKKKAGSKAARKKASKKMAKSKEAKPEEKQAAKRQEHAAKETPKQSQEAKRDYSKIAFLTIFIILVAGFLFYANKAPEPTKVGRVSIPDYTRQEVSFDEAFTLFKEIDDAYNIDYHEESLDGHHVKPGIIPTARDTFAHARESLAKSTGEHRPHILRLFDARIAMLESQRAFQKSISYGMDGAFHKDFDCKKADTLLEATDLYEQALAWGTEANKNLDLVLANYPPSRQIIGTDEQKPKWFNSPLGEISRLIEVNRIQLEKFCGDGASEDATEDVPVEE